MENPILSDKPAIWHYGLMAERWAEFNTDASEVHFFLQEIARHGHPVLDVACGTGRVLLPLLRSGIDVDGCDISKDMLHYCISRAASEAFHPNLYNQPMHALELPRKYKTIDICDSFDLAGSREKDLETLHRCYEHLEDGGALLLNIQAEYTSPELWEWCLSEKRKSLPQPWPENGQRSIASDGSEHVARFRLVEVDPRRAYCGTWRDLTWTPSLPKTCSYLPLVRSPPRLPDEQPLFGNDEKPFNR